MSDLVQPKKRSAYKVLILLCALVGIVLATQYYYFFDVVVFVKGPEFIVGEQSVVWLNEDEFLWTNPGAQMRWCLGIFGIGAALLSGAGFIAGRCSEGRRILPVAVSVLLYIVGAGAIFALPTANDFIWVTLRLLYGLLMFAGIYGIGKSCKRKRMAR